MQFKKQVHLYLAAVMRIMRKTDDDDDDQANFISSRPIMTLAILLALLSAASALADSTPLVLCLALSLSPSFVWSDGCMPTTEIVHRHAHVFVHVPDKYIVRVRPRHDGRVHRPDPVCLRCIECANLLFPHSHIYGCDQQGQRTFNVTFNCRFCYQTPDSAHSCLPLTSCDATKSELTYPTNCTVNNATVCLGDADGRCCCHLTND